MNRHLSTRRVFLQKGLALLAAAPTIPTFLDQTVMALADPLDVKRTQQPSGKDGKILVVVQLSGGNDGLNTVIPYADDTYYKARPTLAVDPRTVLKIDDHIALHPNLAPLNDLFGEGKMAIIQGVGYPNPNRSHFRSMDIWHSGQPEQAVMTSGWLGRYFDNTCSGCDPTTGVAVGGALPLAMQGQRVTPLAFDRPESFRYQGSDQERYLALNQPVEESIVEGTGALAANQLDFLHRTAMDAQMSSDDILRMSRRYEPFASYPASRFAQGLRTVAAMIAGGLPTRVYYVSLGGFDTHANQPGRHDRLMRELAEGVAAFWKDLEHQKNDDRVLMMSFSEFGRRVYANASNGTDHGAAAPMFLFGNSLKHGIVGPHPSLTDLHRGDLKYNMDFRNVYATVLQKWLETPSKPILGAQFTALNVL